MRAMPSRSNFHALTKPLILFCAFCLPLLPVMAEKADRKKPLNVEADNLDHDELKQVSIFTGKVLATKGTDRKSTRLNSSHVKRSRMPSSA